MTNPDDTPQVETQEDPTFITPEAPPEKKRFIDSYIGWFNRWMPESFVICLGLTVFVAILALIFTDTSVFSMASLDKESGEVSLVSAWVGSFWSLLAFAMQMTILLATGNAVAASPPARRLLGALARIPNKPWQFILIGVVAASFFGYFHWGLGMMAGIVLGKEMLLVAKQKGVKLHMPLFVAAIYLAFVPSAAGMSGAAVLYSATPGYLKNLVADDFKDVTPDSVPMTDSVINIGFIGLLAVAVAIAIGFALMMHPKGDKIIQAPDQLLDEIAAGQEKIVVDRSTPGAKANASRWIMYLIGGAGMLYSIVNLAQKGFVGLDLNSFNFLFLSLGLVLCANWGPEFYAKLVREGIAGTWGIILQFPFYAGIFGLITTTGLATVITNAFTSISTPATWPLVAFIYSGILNIAVPSGGSKFVIEAPYIVPTSINQGSDLGLVLQAYQMGDAVTNMLIPFWALPYLANFRLKFSNVVAYTVPPVVAIAVVTSIYMLIMA